tara:strand:- start:4582 stop:4800 length:219 start_codon:yes stop_codon:yes gene_type:complete
MFSKEAFEIPLETQLKLRVMTDEINSCDDIKKLREILIETATLVTRYQVILESTIKEVIERDMETWLEQEFK